MKKCLTLLLLFIFTSSYSQISGIIKDSLNKSPIQYANIWIENENIGTTSNLDGTFKIDGIDNYQNKKLTISILGYQTKTIEIKDETEILLNPSLFELNEVSIIDKKNKNKIEIGKFRKSNIALWYSSGNQPTIISKFISSNSEIEKHPFFRTIYINTLCHTDKAILKLRFLEVGKDGSPGNDLNNEIIIFDVLKGNRKTKIDVEKYDILFPKEGVFIAFEWIITNQNKFEHSYTVAEEDYKIKHLDGVTYDPSIGTIPSENNNSWQMWGGKWFQREKIQSNTVIKGKSRYDNKFGEIAMQIILTD